MKRNIGVTNAIFLRVYEYIFFVKFNYYLCLTVVVVLIQHPTLYLDPSLTSLSMKIAFVKGKYAEYLDALFKAFFLVSSVVESSAALL